MSAIKIKLNQKQLSILAELRGSAANARELMLFGGSRSSKTFLWILAICHRVLSKGGRHIILRQYMTDARGSIWMETLPKVLGLLLGREWWTSVVVRRKLEQQMVIEFANGGEIWVAGLDDKDRVEKILGKEFITIFYNECSQIDYGAVLLVKSRLAQKVEGLRARFLYDFNPPDKSHWTYKYFIKGIDPDSGEPIDTSDVRYWKVNPWDNKENLDEGYIKMLEKMPPALRQRFLEGEFADEGSGAIFKGEWLRYYSGDGRARKKEIGDKYLAIVSSWDTGYSEKDYADPSVGLVWGVRVTEDARRGQHPDNRHIKALRNALGLDGLPDERLDFDLLDEWRGRVTYPDLKKQFERVNLDWGCGIAVVENRASGQTLVQEGYELLGGRVNVVGVNYKSGGKGTRGQGKLTRASDCAIYFERGSVYLPNEAKWRDDYEGELLGFGHPEYKGTKDRVDATSLFLNWVQDGGLDGYVREADGEYKEEMWDLETIDDNRSMISGY